MTYHFVISRFLRKVDRPREAVSVATPVVQPYARMKSPLKQARVFHSWKDVIESAAFDVE